MEDRLFGGPALTAGIVVVDVVVDGVVGGCFRAAGHDGRAGGTEIVLGC